MESGSVFWLCKLIYPTGRTPKHVWGSTCNMQFPRNHRKPQKINLDSQTTRQHTTHTRHTHTHTPHGASRRNHMLKLHCHLRLIKTITMITILMMKMISWLLLLLLSFCRGIQIEIWGRRGACPPLSLCLSLCSFTANIRKLCIFLLYCKKPSSPTRPPLLRPWLSDAAATAGILLPLFVYCVALLTFYLDFVSFFVLLPSLSLSCCYCCYCCCCFSIMHSL